MPSPLHSVVRARRGLLRTTTALSLLSPLLLVATPAKAQQEISPQIEALPTVTVTPTEPAPARPAAPARPRPAASQVGPAAPDLPRPVVVSPTAVPTPDEQNASAVTVITAQDLARDQQRTVPDALRTVPGLHVIQAGGPGANTTVSIRGANPNHTKVLIDGIDVSDPSNINRTFDFGQLLTSDIERIEVLRGPQSGLYGADALGGVISVITKKGEGPPKVAATIEGGSFGTFNQNAQLSGSFNRFNYAFNIAHFRATDTPVTPLELLPPGRRRINDYYENTTFSTKLGADISETFALNFVARYTESTLRFTGDDFSFFPAVPDAAQSTQDLRQFYTRGEAVWSLFDNGFVNRFSLAYTDHYSANRGPDTFGPAVPTINRGDRTRAEYRGDLRLSPGNLLLFGLQYEIETLRTDTTSADNANRGAYVELQSNPLPNTFVTANVRHDDNDRYGGATTYRVAPAYIVPFTETKLKASYGTGFKSPTLNQLFASFPAFNFFGNPNLQPETSTGYDVGFEQPFFNDRVRIGATYFHNDIRDLIAANTTFTSYANFGKVRTEGVETFVSVKVTDRIGVRADYTYTEARDEIANLQLLRRPRHKVSTTATWMPIDTVSLSATVIHVGEFIDGNRDFSVPRLTAPGYTIVNLAGSYAVNPNAKVFARIDNLFDEHYQDPTGFLRPGIGAFAGVRFNN